MSRLRWSAILPVVLLTAILAALSSAPEPAMAGVEITPRMADMARQKGAVPVIVLLDEGRTAVPQAGSGVGDAAVLRRENIARIQEAALMELDAAQAQIGLVYDNAAAFSASLTPEGLADVAAMDGVRAIMVDGRVEAHTSQGVALMNPETFRSTYGGAGTAIAIVDTGIDYTHPALGGGGFPNDKVIGGTDLGDRDDDPLDCAPHGTQVAGVAAGTDTQAGDYTGGVAPEAKLYAVKIVSGCSRSTSFSLLAAGWDWAISHQHDDPDNPIVAINTSFGGGGFDSTCDATFPIFAELAAAARAAGIIPLVSSGNDGLCSAMASPACVSQAVSVGSVIDADLNSGATYCVSSSACTGEYSLLCSSRYSCSNPEPRADQPACYSNTAPFLDLLAPGYPVTAPTTNGGYQSNLAGTSISAPFAAGAAAVIQSYWKRATGSFLSVDELTTRLTATGAMVRDDRNGLTFPRVDIARAASDIFGVEDLSNGQQVEVSLRGGQVAYYRLEAPLGVIRFTAQITNISEDLDLDVRYGEQPTLETYDCRSARGSFMDENCSFVNPARGWWYVTVRTKETGTGLLRLTYEVESPWWWW